MPRVENLYNFCWSISLNQFIHKAITKNLCANAILCYFDRPMTMAWEIRRMEPDEYPSLEPITTRVTIDELVSDFFGVFSEISVRESIKTLIDDGYMRMWERGTELPSHLALTVGSSNSLRVHVDFDKVCSVLNPELEALRNIKRNRPVDNPTDPAPAKPSKLKRPVLSARKRFAVLHRDHFTCQYCGRTAPDVELEVDHINPVSDGGVSYIDNLVAACADCNYGKGSYTLTTVKRATGMWNSVESDGKENANQ